ncbi:MAG: hypothetical protein KatS3mg097_289 [Candidatus Parcubacteria bacterium]|nr:MAG: hypothetical protein KatS3mg097_289 [Candidatus Parcubacteria bacterium]
MIIRRDEFRNFLDKFFEGDLIPFKDVNYLASNIYETDKDVVVELQIPGFDKKDIKVSFQEGYLKIEGKSSEEKEEKNKNYWRREIKKGSFLKVIPIPKEVDHKQAKASLTNGILKVVLPKIEKTIETGKEIKIE